MFATEWGKKNKVNKKKDFRFVKKVSSMVWAEHCVECAYPLCYGTCPKYRRRRDGRCRLFKDGINKNKGSGLLGYNVTISFEGWSKLEATYRPKQHKLFTIKCFELVSDITFKISKFLSSVFERKCKTWKLTNFAYKVREGFSLLLNKYGKNPDAFLLDIDNNDKDVELILEAKNINQTPLFKKSFLVKNSHNQVIIPFDEMKVLDKNKSFIFIYPTRDVSLTFNALDYVSFSKKYKENINQGISNNINIHKKIKCVAWDLDNTLWDGVLIEEKVKLNNEIKNLIIELDQKGIVNSIISKNDHDEGMTKLKEFGIDQYFVFPQINWNPKSVNISNLAKKMNIGIDTICFIDDSPFELAEVSSTLKDVLCINVKDYKVIESFDSFNTLVSDDSKKRRLTYQMMEKEQNELEHWEGNIDSFLRSCQIEITISKPKENEYQRCFELMQRTNQLNSSGRRLTYDEIVDYINSNDFETFVIKCKDKFGDYGIVGFSIYDKNTKTITDFVISCRVANKTIEHTFIQYVAAHYSKDGVIYMFFKKSSKNGPMFKVLQDLNMHSTDNNQEIELLEYDNSLINQYDLVKLVLQ